ncbi:unnamed protein product, partial [Rotaria magnacalcarata]
MRPLTGYFRIVLLFALPVLSFIRRLSACNPEAGDPIIVHCLAVVDTVLNKICEHLSLNMPSFLKHIRQQRNRVTDFRLSFEQIDENLSKNITQDCRCGDEYHYGLLEDYVNSPIVVHDLFGGYQDATFCALYAIIERMKLEGRLNIYVLAKLYHLRRSGIWQHN